jgi:hypothetical protein
MPDLKNLGVTNRRLNYQRTIFLDVDDTILDTMGGFISWLDDQNRIDSVKTPRPTDFFDLGAWLGVENDLARFWYKEFTQQTWQWGALRSIQNAQAVLPVIQRQGWRISGMAHGTGELARAQLRRANLELLFPGVFRDIFVVPHDQSFYPFMREHDDGIFITANTRTAQDAAEAGHSAYIFAQTWNTRFRDIRVRSFPDWNSILTVLTTDQSVIKV